jgi:hypothetical protein
MNAMNRTTRIVDFLRRLHRDERGVISVLSVFALFLFTILLVLIVNSGRQIDDKIRMQNAADAAAYSGGVAVARGMNALAFSNHLLCEVFALTAYMREGRDRHSDPFVPPILSAWQAVGERFAGSTTTPKFRGLGTEIIAKVPVEQELVDEFSEMTYHQARITLPHFEYILCGPDFDDPPSVEGNRSPEGGFIPRFQRAVVRATPTLAQVATDEIARRYGTRTENLHRNQPLFGVLWRSSVEKIGVADESDFRTRTLPAVDPSPFSDDGAAIYGDPQFDCFFCIARSERRRLARSYLTQWTTEWQSPYFEFPHNASPHRGSETAKMSNYINLFRIFACGQLDVLLEQEYPDTNLPHLLREIRRENCEGLLGPDCWPEQNGPCVADVVNDQQLLERDYMFIAGTYWPPLQTMFPGLCQNPLARDSRTYAVTFAQAHVYIPRARFACCPWSHPVLCYDDDGRPMTCWVDHYDNWPRRWDLFNQNWTVKLTPATATQWGPILATHPGGTVQGYDAPAVWSVSDEDLRAVNFH